MRDFEGMMFLQMMGAGSVVDWVVILSFFAVALTYFLAPVLGYNPERRGMVGASLYLLLAYAGISVLQYALLYLQMMDPGGGRPDDLTRLVLFGFSILKGLFFFLALLLYVLGLQSLRMRRPDDRDLRRDDWRDEPRYDR